MLKLAILIKPNFKIKNLCFSTKKKFKIKYGKQKYLDHFPHVTILTINVKNNFINNIDEIVNSYNYKDFTTESGSFSHIIPSVDVVFLKTFSSISLLSIIRYGFLLLLSLMPLLFFVKIKENLVNKYFKFGEECVRKLTDSSESEGA